MITKVTANEITKAKTFECKDDKTGEVFSRVALKESLEVEPMISNSEAAFSDKTIEKFKKWLNDKGYLKTDCWCHRIKEFVDAGI
jgi:hypothetical protein